MRQYIVDTFTETLFKGNPAAVCITDAWLSDQLMLDIAKENNLSETAFAIKQDDRYLLRWFTPGEEIDLCGHATLATAFVIMRYLEPETTSIDFQTKSGILTVIKKGEMLELDFPAFKLVPYPITDALVDAIGKRPIEAYLGRDLLCIMDSQDDVTNIKIDETKTKALDGLLLHVTAISEAYDCVSRSFAPKLDIYEDPVCGSGHCHIVPYWSNKLKKNKIKAYQASARGGTLFCEYDGKRVKMQGSAVLYAIAELFLEPDITATKTDM